MAVAYTQEHRSMRVHTPLPTDTLLLERLVGNESVSRPFELTLHLLSPDSAVDPKALLRKPMTVTVEIGDGQSRHFHGIVRRFVQGGRDQGLVSYEATIVPSLWLLSLATDCRIFQNKTVPDIAKAVLDGMGITDYRLNLAGSYPPREYCVQYRETHLDFLSRLLEEEGIFYFFEHSSDKHTLVLADASSAVKPGPIPRLPTDFGEEGQAWANFIQDLEIGSVVSSGKVTLVDYNDVEPKRLETSVAGGANSTGAASLRLFDYPGKFSVLSDGERLARVRMEESEAATRVISGRATCGGLATGHKLEVINHYRRDVNGAYHVLSLWHDGRVNGYRSTASASEPEFSFESAFTAIPHAIPFRPERVTPKSIVHGTQTAIVVGPSGEEIFVDKLGRVKVQFFWDQAGKKDETSSCWVRVSSSWAGKQWGAIQIPRIGQEVIVDFLDGDPDRPIITGRVYNGEQMPPYALPANGTQSGVKSRSSKGGGASEANELRFEDKKGAEQVYLHAQKDLRTIVLNDETRSVGNNRTTTIGYDEKKTVSKGDETITIEQGSQTVKVYQDHSLTITMGNTTTQVEMGDQSTTIKMGNATIKANLGSINSEAMQGIELKVGQSSVKLDQMGVTIKGMMIKIEGQIQTEVKGLMTVVNGDAMLKVNGGITMIN